MTPVHLLANYGKYGVTRAELEPIIDDGIQNYDLSLEAIYSGLRMSLASAFNEHEYFKPVEPQRAAGYYFPNGLH